MRILIATGGGEHANKAIQLGGLAAQLTGASLTLLTVIKRESDRMQGEMVLGRAVGLLPTAVSFPHTCLRIGHPADEIVREAKAGGYDLVVMGTRPFHNLFKHFLGSVAERVITQAPCPIIIAKTDTDSLRRILVCEGGREPSLLSRFIARLPALITNGTELKILHVMSQMAAAPGLSDWPLQANAAELMQQQTPEGQLLEQDIRLLSQSHIPSQAQVRHGLVVDEILAEADSGSADLIVIGAHQENGWWLENLSRQIVTQANKPVLVV